MRYPCREAILVLVYSLISAVPGLGQVGSSDQTKAASQAVLIGVNPAEQYLQMAADRERAALNLPPLRRDPALASAARLHALQMLEQGSISHQFRGEPELAARGAAAGARFSRISENVAVSSTAARIHEAWMRSEGHRHNLLDTTVDAVGIAVVARAGRLYAVEDFERTVEAVPLRQQETEIAAALASTGVAVSVADEEARRRCAGGAQLSGGRRPSFVMRYTTANLERVPTELQAELATGRYGQAVVAACSTDTGEFSMYSIAVLLYRSRSD